MRSNNTAARIYLREYEQVTYRTRDYPEPIVYPTLSLCGETGEAANIIKKAMRLKQYVSAVDGTSILQLTTQQKAKFIEELGDALWYIVAAATDVGSSLYEVIETNKVKVLKRKEDGDIHTFDHKDQREKPQT
jgi:NTP pyrophosphatase (non-canonical NTP hydrolase)